MLQPIDYYNFRIGEPLHATEMFQFGSRVILGTAEGRYTAQIKNTFAKHAINLQGNSSYIDVEFQDDVARNELAKMIEEETKMIVHRLRQGPGGSMFTEDMCFSMDGNRIQAEMRKVRAVARSHEGKHAWRLQIANHLSRLWVSSGEEVEAVKYIDKYIKSLHEPLSSDETNLSLWLFSNDAQFYYHGQSIDAESDKMNPPAPWLNAMAAVCWHSVIYPRLARQRRHRPALAYGVGEKFISTLVQFGRCNVKDAISRVYSRQTALFNAPLSLRQEEGEDDDKAATIYSAMGSKNGIATITMLVHDMAALKRAAIEHGESMSAVNAYARLTYDSISGIYRRYRQGLSGQLVNGEIITPPGTNSDRETALHTLILKGFSRAQFSISGIEEPYGILRADIRCKHEIHGIPCPLRRGTCGQAASVTLLEAMMPEFASELASIAKSNSDLRAGWKRSATWPANLIPIPMLPQKARKKTDAKDAAIWFTLAETLSAACTSYSDDGTCEISMLNLINRLHARGLNVALPDAVSAIQYWTENGELVGDPKPTQISKMRVGYTSKHVESRRLIAHSSRVRGARYVQVPADEKTAEPTARSGEKKDAPKRRKKA